MNQIRSSKFRKWVIALFLIVGVFPTIQSAFACEKIDDRLQFTADCMQMDGSFGMENSAKSCEDKPDCMNGSTNTSNSMSENCCDSSHHIVATVNNTTQDSSFQAVLMLDGPQPPPVIPSATQMLALNQCSTVQRLIIAGPKHLSASDTYLKTQRFRI